MIALQDTATEHMQVQWAIKSKLISIVNLWEEVILLIYFELFHVEFSQQKHTESLTTWKPN